MSPAPRLAGIPGNHDGYGELMADVRTVAWDNAKSLLEVIEQLGADRSRPSSASRSSAPAAIYPPPEGYLARGPARSAGTTTSCSSPTR